MAEKKTTKKTAEKAEKTIKKKISLSEEKTTKATKKVTKKVKNPEVAQEPVVPADMELPESENKATRRPKTTKKVSAPKKTKTAPKKALNEPQEAHHYANIGTKSQELELYDQRNLVSDEEKEHDLFVRLNKYRKSQELCWGEVFAVESNDRAGTCNVAVYFDGQKILIPSYEYFEDNFDFGTRFHSETDPKRKFERIRTFLNYQMGARICFLIKAVDTVRETDINGFEENRIIAVASRKEAMALLRDKYFFHTLRKAPVYEKTEIRIGSTADANVISVKENLILVECFGVETRIQAKDTCDDFVENCMDRFKPGDTLKVKVKKLYINDGKVYLALTGRTLDPSKAIASMKVGMTILGTVDNVNKEKQIYTVLLKNGVIASVRFDNVQGGVPMYIGSVASVFVTHIHSDKGFVFGKAVKLR